MTGLSTLAESAAVSAAFLGWRTDRLCKICLIHEIILKTTIFSLMFLLLLASMLLSVLFLSMLWYLCLNIKRLSIALKMLTL